MSMDTSNGRTRARNFALRGAAWSLGLFGLLRLSWVEAHWLLPLTQLQARLAVSLCGTPARPIAATLDCSGADALALCVGAILAYPVRWRLRLAGAAGGVALVLGLNTLRIGTLGRAAASPVWFETLHLYLWPAALILAVAAYVFGWMRVADLRESAGHRQRTSVTPESARDPVPAARLSVRFIVSAASFLVLFTIASPLYLESAGVLSIAAWIAQVTAAVLHAVGVDARVEANVLWTARGGFAVTQECISTPLIPIYLAAVFAYAGTWHRRALGLAAAAPLFVGLGIARLLVVALPAVIVASPLPVVHAFYQVLLAAVVVSTAAWWRHGAGGTAVRRAGAGMAMGVVAAWLLGAPYAHALTHAAQMIVGSAGTPLDDPQGAIAFLPAFQTGLYTALWVAACARVGWRRFPIGLGLLALLQIATLAAVLVVAGSSGLRPPVRDVRAWAVVLPLLVAAAVAYTRWPCRRSTQLAAAVAFPPASVPEP